MKIQKSANTLSPGLLCKVLAAFLVVLFLGIKLYSSGGGSDNPQVEQQQQQQQHLIGEEDGATADNIMPTKSSKSSDGGADMATYDQSERNKGETNTSSEKQAAVKTHKDEDSHDFPSLQSLTDGKTVKGDVSWMLDFAITGFAKCGTTWMMNYLRKNGRNNGEIWVNQGEVHFMRKPEGPAKMVDLMYKTHETDRLDGTKRIYGIKNPAEMEIEGSLEQYAKYFPNTKFIISLRHPGKRCLSLALLGYIACYFAVGEVL